MDAPDMVELKYGPADACRTKIFVAAGKSRESAGYRATAAATSEPAQVADYLNRFHQLAIARSLVHRSVRRSRLLFGAALLATAVPGRRSRAPWRGCCNRRRDALITRIVDAKNEQITKSTRELDPSLFKDRAFDHRFDLPRKLAAGEYLFTVEITAGGKTSDRALRFRVR
jgi:hypothetical protein